MKSDQIIVDLQGRNHYDSSSAHKPKQESANQKYMYI